MKKIIVNVQLSSQTVKFVKKNVQKNQLCSYVTGFQSAPTNTTPVLPWLWLQPGYLLVEIQRAGCLSCDIQSAHKFELWMASHPLHRLTRNSKHTNACKRTAVRARVYHPGRSESQFRETIFKRSFSPMGKAKKNGFEAREVPF